jgi:hypothetical protein
MSDCLFYSPHNSRLWVERSRENSYATGLGVDVLKHQDQGSNPSIVVVSLASSIYSVQEASECQASDRTFKIHNTSFAFIANKW